MQTLINFLDQQDIQLLPYQEEVIQTFQKDTNGIIEAPTGRGKTLAMALAIIHDAQEKNIRPKMVWVTPMRALARYTAHQLTTIFSYLSNIYFTCWFFIYI